MEYFVKIKLIRTENKLTQEQVANALGITRSAYCGYEIGRRKMSTEMLEKLAKFYRVSINTFFNSDVKTLNDSEHYNEKSMYLSSLSKDERELIARYRVLDEAEKAEVRNAANKKKNDGE